MGISIRGLTRGVMGGITAYRRGALQGQEQNREIAAAEQARQRQKEQDEQTALYREVESNLARRAQTQREKEYTGGEALRAADVAATNALAVSRKNPRRPTRVIAEAGRQILVYADTGEPVEEYGPRPRSGGGGGFSSADQRLYQQIQAEAHQRYMNHTARMGSGAAGDRTYRRRVQNDPRLEKTEETETNAVINDRFRRGLLTTAQRDRFLGGAPAPVNPYR